MASFIHPKAHISPMSVIEESSRGTDTTIGQGSFIDDFVKIKHVGGTGNISIGENVYINSGCVFYSGNGIAIGNDVLIGPNCNLVPVNHQFEDLPKPIRLQGFTPSKGGILICDNVWIGAGVTILDGTVIESGAIIGANSLVSGLIKGNGVYAGVPCKLIKKRE